MSRQINLKRRRSPMASETSPEANNKRRRIMIITADESVIEEFEKGNNELLMQKIHTASEIDISPRSNRQITTEPLQEQKKRLSASLICVICGAPATGYNFGAIACESCKAFFRRNAFKNLAIFRCRQKGVCEVTFKIRPSCPPCRLEKCFKNGMLRERIATAEQKAAKRRKIEENRSLKPNYDAVMEEQQWSEASSILPDDLSTTINTDILHLPEFLDLLSPTSSKPAESSLSLEDLQRVESISLMYKKRIEMAAREGLPWDPSTQPTTYIETLNSRAVSVMRLLSFFKQIPEFDQLKVNDKITLIKYNLMIALGMNSTLLYNPQTKQTTEADTDTPWNTQFCQLLYGHDMLTKVKKICTDLTSVAKHDEAIIQLTLVIVILTNGLSTAIDDGSMVNDGMAVHRAQTHYVDLLWKYMDATLGFEKTIQLYSSLVFSITSWQTVLEEMRHHIVRVLSPTDVDELLPIIKSVFRITP